MTAANERADVVATETVRHLNACAAADPVAARMAAYHWLQDQSEGVPLVALSQETARRDALYWSETATPLELECYLVAAADRLIEYGSLFHTRQIRRVIAATWERMTDVEKHAFITFAHRKSLEK